MSTFNGKILEIPQISVDNFTDDNHNSSVYFLSHCHTDHMKGLSDWSFQKSLTERSEVYLYASPISVKILKHIYPEVERKLKEISINNSTLITIPDCDTSLTVTALPAGHCPGSVMFLFQTKDKNVLYTGDYRVSVSDLKKYKAFYSLGEIKRIDKMYLDTTFFNLSYYKLPPRHVALNSVCSVIKDWLGQSCDHIVEIYVSATYGSEFLFVEIAKETAMPIHVNKTTFNLYKCIPEMDKSVTLNGKETQIHANCGSRFKEICKKDLKYIKRITPSTLWWKGKNMENGCMELTEDGVYRFCYSCHASCEEIEDFLLFLKPIEVEPCVVSKNQAEKDEMFKLLENVMSSYKTKPLLESTQSKLFKNDAHIEQRTPEKFEDSALEDVLRSPARDFKRRRLWLKDEDPSDINVLEDNGYLN